MGRYRDSGSLTWVHDPVTDLVGAGRDCAIRYTCVCYKEDGSKLVCTGLDLPLPHCTKHSDD